MGCVCQREAEGDKSSARGIRIVDGGNAHGIYLLVGEEGYLKEEFLHRLKSAIFKKEPCGLDFNKFYASQTGAGEVIAAALTLPFSSPKRLVIIKDPQKFSAQDTELLLSFLANPPASTCVVLDSQEKMQGSPILNAIAKNGVVKKFDKLKYGELSRWIDAQIKSRGLKIAADAVSAIEELVGNDLSAIANALDKISLYGSSKKDALKRQDVEALCGAVSTRTSFELIDAMKRKDRSAALKILGSLLRGGEKPTKIIGALIWHVGRLLKARSLIERGASKEEIASQTKVPHYLLEEFIREVRSCKEGPLLAYTDELCEAESAIKTGRISERVAVELCVVKLSGLGL